MVKLFTLEKESQQDSFSSANNEVVLSVKNVYKKFCKDLKYSMIYGMIDLVKNLIGIKPDYSKLRKHEFWALENVSFELKKGQVLGLIGINGSGKTTLLRLIAGIYPPDKGEIKVKGRVGSLIALGAGFHPHMSGRENIYLNGAILGMNKKEIEEMVDFIIDFSELGDFIDAPVSTYSSGMRVRLGFSIAIAMKPDIVLLDEVLAVGDRKFKAKCYKEIDKLIKNSAVIFVSHSMPNILRVSTHIMVLNKGKVDYMSNNVYEGIEYYYSLFPSDESSYTGLGARILDFKMTSKSGYKNNNIYIIKYLDTIDLYTTVKFSPKVKSAIIHLNFIDKEFNTIAIVRSDITGFYIKNTGSPVELKITIPKIQLSAGKYSITIKIIDQETNELLLTYHNISEFQVAGDVIVNAPFHLDTKWEYACKDLLSI